MTRAYPIPLPPARACRGFSLLEILVAFAILALSLGVLLQIFSSGLRNVLVGEGYARAADLAESQLALVGTELPVQPGILSGVQDGYRWTLGIQPQALPELAAAPPNLMTYWVTVQVRWGDDTTGRGLELNSLRLVQQ